MTTIQKVKENESVQLVGVNRLGAAPPSQPAEGRPQVGLSLLVLCHSRRRRIFDHVDVDLRDATQQSIHLPRGH